MMSDGQSETTLTEWRVVYQETGEAGTVTLARRNHRGRKPKVRTIHKQIVDSVSDPAPRHSVRFMLDGNETPVVAGGATREPFSVKLTRHRELLRKRKSPLAYEAHLPTGQAALWHADVIRCVPRSGREAARQIARLCGGDSRVTVPIRSLADAVGRMDRSGRLVAYTERGIETLAESGWLRVETTGSGQNIATTFYLLPGDRRVEWYPEAEDDWLEETALAE